MRSRSAPWLLLLLVLNGGAAWAGALDRFEQAHRPPHEGRSDDRSSSSSTDDDDDYDDDDDEYEGDYEHTEVSGDGSWALFFLCAPPPLLFACVHPAHRPAQEPYGADRLYLEPLGERSADGIISKRAYRPSDRERFRWAELSLSGFRALNEPVVYSHDVDGTVWLGPVVLHLGWEHFYEQLEGAARWDHLNVYGAHLGSNATGPWIDGLELYLLAGASAIHGDAFTPAFDAGLELRAYPVEPLALYGAATVSVFEHGPLLLDAHAEVGVALGPAEIRAGPRWLYQGDAQGFWGPRAALLLRY